MTPQATEFHLRVRLRMSDTHAAVYRAEHDLDPADSVRERLADTIHAELTGLGEERGWWGEVTVR